MSRSGDRSIPRNYPSLVARSRAGRVEWIHRFPRLKVNIGILRGAANDRMIGREGAGAMFEYALLVDHRAHTSSAAVSILEISCEVRKPSKKCRNGMRASSVAA